MILAFDTYYFDDKANTACISFCNWSDTMPLKIQSEIIEGIADYEPAAFYKRELPSILNMVNKMDLSEVEFIVIDGYVTLDDSGKLGLGGYLYESLDKKIPVIGVAKSGFYSMKRNVRQLIRGVSKKPLYITSAGVDLDSAYEMIKSMEGRHRIPDLLKILDTKTKE